MSTPRVCKSLWGEMLLSPIHCCDITKPPYLLSGKLCTSPLHSNCLFVYTVCCRRGGQCISVLRTRHTDIVGEVTSPRSDTMCHFCTPVVYPVVCHMISVGVLLLYLCNSWTWVWFLLPISTYDTTGVYWSWNGVDGHVGFMVDEMESGKVFLRVSHFPCK